MSAKRRYTCAPLVVGNETCPRCGKRAMHSDTRVCKRCSDTREFDSATRARDSEFNRESGRQQK